MNQKNLAFLPILSYFSRCFPSMEDFHRQFGHPKTSLGGRIVAFDKRTIVDNTPRHQKPPAAVFSALTCVLEVNFWLRLLISRNIVVFFWRFGPNYLNLEKCCKILGFYKLSGLIRPPNLLSQKFF